MQRSAPKIKSVNDDFIINRTIGLTITPSWLSPREREELSLMFQEQSASNMRAVLNTAAHILRGNVGENALVMELQNTMMPHYYRRVLRDVFLKNETSIMTMGDVVFAINHYHSVIGGLRNLNVWLPKGSQIKVIVDGSATQIPWIGFNLIDTPSKRLLDLLKGRMIPMMMEDFESLNPRGLRAQGEKRGMLPPS